MRSILYHLFGPTTKHLQLEWYLVLCLTLFTASSLHGLYKQEFLTHRQDYIFLVCHALWLSKYWIVRCLCLWDPTTHLTPSLRGWMALFLSSHVTGGQVFDRPQRKFLSKQVEGVAARDEATYASLVPTVFNYGWQWYKMRIWLPLLRFLDGSKMRRQRHRRTLDPNAVTQNYSSGTTPTSNSSSNSSSLFSLVFIPPFTIPWLRRGGGLHAVYQTVSQYALLLWSKGPTLQFLLPNVLSYIVLYPVAIRFRSNEQPQAPTVLYNPSLAPHSFKQDELRLKRYGGYFPLKTITLTDLFTIVMGISLLILCVSFFSRVFPPFPDQIAGNNVATDVRNDAKVQKSTGSSKAGGSSKNKISTTSTEPTQVWTERHSPIVTENRVRVHRMVLLWRLLDIWLCCGWLPRSDLLARALGHTSSNVHLPHRLAQDLFPTGITRPLRSDTWFRSWEKQIRDPISTVWHVWNLALVPVLILGVQLLYLNRTYIAISSYFATEWTLIGYAEPDDIATSLGNWDARKKYKKDDLVICNEFLYQASHNQPEGRPVEPDIRDWQDPALYELGHPGTSAIVNAAYTIQLISTLLQTAWWLTSFFYRDGTPDGLLIAVISNLIASHALSNVGVSNCDELSRISKAIAGEQ